MMNAIFFILLVATSSAFANEGGGEHGGGEAKEGAAPAAGGAAEKNTKELADTEKQVASLSAKIKAKSDSVEALLKQKTVEKDPEKLAEIVKFVQQEHRDLQNLTKEYNTQLNILQYRFPERGVTLGRRYQRLDTKSLEEMEKTLGLDANLSKARSKVKMVYGVKDEPRKNKDAPISKDKEKNESLLQPSTLSK